jgi:hypothetical protein
MGGGWSENEQRQRMKHPHPEDEVFGLDRGFRGVLQSAPSRGQARKSGV